MPNCPNGHVCDTNNQYYKYAQEKGYSLTAVIPKNHCWICGSQK